MNFKNFRVESFLINATSQSLESLKFVISFNVNKNPSHQHVFQTLVWRHLLKIKPQGKVTEDKFKNSSTSQISWSLFGMKNNLANIYFCWFERSNIVQQKYSQTR